jgi:hypothetical protein
MHTYYNRATYVIKHFVKMKLHFSRLGKAETCLHANFTKVTQVISSCRHSIWSSSRHVKTPKQASVAVASCEVSALGARHDALETLEPALLPRDAPVQPAMEIVARHCVVGSGRRVEEPVGAVAGVYWNPLELEASRA